MAKGTTFGTIHSNRDMGLIQQNYDVGTAVPKTSNIDVPGMDGNYDTTEMLDGVKFKNRTIEWTFALYPGANWEEKKSLVSNLIDGKRMQITLDDDPDYYYDGRITVKKHKSSKMLKQITVSADCKPYKRKKTEHVITNTLTTSEKTIILPNGYMPIHPEITVDVNTSFTFGETTFALTPGTHTVLAISLHEGNNILLAKGSSAGNITIKYREGSL